MNAQVQAVDFTSFVFAQGDDIKTTSRIVAEKFGKRHDNVLATIDKILTQVSDIFGKLNFKETEYVQNNNLGIPVSYRMFEMTKDGFMILVMGFTGIPAMQVKETYINAFNFMLAKLKPVPNALRDLPPQTITPAMQRQVQKAISGLVKNQVGTTYSGLYGQIKDKFDVGSYKDVPFKRYGELCAFLNIEPIEGELVEPAKLEYQPPKGMVLIAENELEALRKTPPVNLHQLPENCVIIPRSEYDAFKKLDDIVSGIRFSLKY